MTRHSKHHYITNIGDIGDEVKTTKSFVIIRRGLPHYLPSGLYGIIEKIHWIDNMPKYTLAIPPFGKPTVGPEYFLRTKRKEKF